VDTVSYSKLGETWRATDWIAELALTISYRIGQWRGLTEIVAVTCGLISGVLTFYFARILRLSIAMGLPVLIIFLISPNFLRVQLFFLTYL
jgi:hypothetical protein